MAVNWLYVGAVIAGVLVAVLLLHRLLWLGLRLLLWSARSFPPRLRGSPLWARTHPLRARFAARFPRTHVFLRARLSPHPFTGLPLTLMAAAALYLAALFGGLVEDLLNKDPIVHIDAAVNAFFGPYRVEPLLAIFLWLTSLGAGPAVVAVAVATTGLLWADRRERVIPPLWVTLLGAEATTWAGKFLIERHRPEFIAAASAASPSFPSAHATASMAVYGFLAYAVARDLPRLRPRFEVAFWGGVLIASIGFSRIFLSVHYLSDVLSGFLVGGFWLLVGYALAERGRTPRAGPPAG